MVRVDRPEEQAAIAGTYGVRQDDATPKRNVWRVVAVCLITVACLALVVGTYAAFLTDKDATERDFIEYWAAGQQLIHGANPYDAVAILRLQRAAGLEEQKPKITFSPPTLLLITLPLGFFSPKVGLILWLLVLVTCLILSIWLIWVLCGRPDSGLHYCGFLFAPAAACLMAGQLGIFLLLGVVVFLRLYKSHPYVAGMALLPCAWKPHLFFPFFAALLLWSVMRKEYRIFAGFFLMVVLSCAAITRLNTHVWSQYSEMMRATGVLHAFVPTLSVTLRFLIDRNAVWLQFVPEAAACVWALWYFWTRRTRWDWMDHGLLVLLVSFLCAPYAWFSDEAVLLAPVLAGVFRASETRRSLVPIGFIAGLALLEVSTVGKMASAYYLWTTPAWLAWYLFANWTRGEQRTVVIAMRKQGHISSG
jgi:hypothetical protein